MLDPKKLLDDLLGSKMPGGGSTVRDTAGKATQMARDNPLAAGALAAVLLGTGTGRKLTGSALKLGGMAAVAGLAYKAYQNYQSGKQPGAGQGQTKAEPELLPPPTDTAFDPARAPQGEAEFALVIARAMIAAARADGHIDEAERVKIADKLKLSGLGGEAEQFLLGELDKPVDVDSLVAAAQTDAQKVELYTASRLAIEPQTRAERGYLDMLAGRLRLPDPLIDHVEATVAEAKSEQTNPVR
jgi:uncharacterized membrane protein YebE (DUF533 family)